MGCLAFFLYRCIAGCLSIAQFAQHSKHNQPTQRRTCPSSTSADHTHTHYISLPPPHRRVRSNEALFLRLLTQFRDKTLQQTIERVQFGVDNRIADAIVTVSSCVACLGHRGG